MRRESISEPLGYQLPPITYYQALQQSIILVDGRTVSVKEATAKEFNLYIINRLWLASGSLKSYVANNRELRKGLNCAQWPEHDRWYALCELMRIIAEKESNVKLFVEQVAC